MAAGRKGPTAVRIDGSRELEATLRAAGADMADMRDVWDAIAELVTPRIVAAAPRRSGRLAASVRGTGQKTGASERAGGKSIPYARPIHWGWPARHIAPQRFMWDVVIQMEAQWTDTYRSGVDRILSKVRGV